MELTDYTDVIIPLYVSVKKVHNAFIYGLFAKPANLTSG